MLKGGRLQQIAGEVDTRWRKFELCFGLKDGASQNWWQETQTQRDETISRRWCLVILENHLSMADFFLELLPRKFYACIQTTSGESKRTKGTDGQTAYSLYVRIAAKKSTFARLSKTFFDGSDFEEEKFRARL